MLDVCLLGTGGMMPLPYRWLTSLMLRYNGKSILIDCGEGTQVAMKEKGWGRIVTLGSVNQYNQHPELSLYGVSKAAQLKLVKNIAPALAPYGVTVNNVAPGAIDTPRNASVTENDALRRAVEAKIPCGRFGRPEEIAPVVLLLCSEEGAYMTGSDVVIDGGLSLK